MAMSVVRTIPVVYFSFKKDEALLSESVKAVRRIEDGDASLRIPVYVFDDGEHPMDTIPEGVHYEATHFPRNGNLMGPDCLRGMVGCYNKVFACEPDARVLVKCDCDTVLNRLDAAMNAKAGLSLSGSRWGCNFVCGQRYAITREAAHFAGNIVNGIYFDRWLARTGVSGEDASLTVVCMRVPFCRIVFDNPKGLIERALFHSPFDPRLQGADAVVVKAQSNAVSPGLMDRERDMTRCLMAELNSVSPGAASLDGERIRIRDGRLALDAVVCDGFVDIRGARLPIAGKLADGSLRLSCAGGLERVLVRNPYTNVHVLTMPGGCLPLRRNKDWCQLVKCDKMKFACFIISKNGCSCIMASALKYDGKVSLGGKFVWNTPHYRYKCLLDSRMAADVLASGALDGYRKFVVVQDERERFCRAVNWTHCQRSGAYNPYVDLSLPRHESFMEHLLLYPYMTSDEYNCDQHFLPQQAHIDAAVRRVYGGDADRFGAEVERVELAYLAEWFKDAFGVPMELNNMDSAEDTVYWPCTLSEEERTAMEAAVKPLSRQ